MTKWVRVDSSRFFWFSVDALILTASLFGSIDLPKLSDYMTTIVVDVLVSTCRSDLDVLVARDMCKKDEWKRKVRCAATEMGD